MDWYPSKRTVSEWFKKQNGATDEWLTLRLPLQSGVLYTKSCHQVLQLKNLARRGLEILREDGVANFVVSVVHYLKRRFKLSYEKLKFRISSEGYTNIGIFGEPVKISSRNFEQYQRASEYKESSNSREKEILHLLLQRAEEGDVFYDIGANIGVYSCVAAKNISDCKVIAFEPYPPNVEEIKTNADLNNIAIDVHPIALSENSGSTELQILKTKMPGGQEHTLSEATYNQNTHLEKETIEVNKKAGDELIRGGKISPPNILKIDVEGAGPAVIRGLSEYLDAYECHTVIIEPHNNILEIKEELQKFGHRIEEKSEYIYAYREK